MTTTPGGKAPLRNVKYQEIMEELGIAYSRMRRLWRTMPHSYVGDPDKIKSLRHARFNVEEIRAWASKEAD